MKKTYGASDIIRTIMKAQGVTQKALAPAVGRERSNVSRILDRDGMNVNTLCDFLSALGYELVIQPRTHGKRPDWQYVVEQVSDGAKTEQDKTQNKPITLEALRSRDY